MTKKTSISGNSKSEDKETRWAGPLEELLEHQRILLRAARKAALTFQEMDDPQNLLDDVMEQSSQLWLFEKKGVSMDIFKSAFLEMDQTVTHRVREVKQKLKRKRWLKEIGAIYDEERANFYKNLGEHCAAPEEFRHLELELTRWLKAPSSGTLIMQSLYVLCFAHFENFLSSTTKMILEDRDNILGELQRKFTWSQIREQDFITRIKKEMVEQTVEGLLRQSMGAWISWHKQKTKLKIPANLAEECVSHYEVRNIFAHEESATVSYLNIAKVNLVEHISEALAKMAFHMVESAAHASKNKDQIATFYRDLTMFEVSLLDERRRALVEHICEFVIGTREDPSEAAIHQVNYWISKKSQDEFDSLAEIVETWDPSGLDPVFLLAKEVLVGNPENSRLMADAMIKRGDLPQSAWNTWPLFRQLRNIEFPRNPV